MPDKKVPSKHKVEAITRHTGPSPQSYSLPPLVGYQKHAPTHYKNPAWVYGPDKGKEKSLVSYSPGPKYKIDPDITRFGRNAKVPAYIGIKLPSQSKYLPKDAHRIHGTSVFSHPAEEYKTPAPNAYAPENSRDGTKTRAPAWNHAYRTDLIKQDQTPGPGAYDHKPDWAAPLTRTSSGLPAPPTTASLTPAFTSLGHLIILKRAGTTHLTPRRQTAALRAIDYRAGKRPPAWVFGDKHSPYLTPLILPEDDTYPSPVVNKKHLKDPCRPNRPPICEKKPCVCKPTKVVCRPIKTS
uniref:Outer dense fiber protein 3 n=1 Tax=Timema bartmani TaxID=61472 RepID=A0A7R9F433_9NEOP|nr:unnamed protein product [Timema bartmani]